mgnify:CR=1 FL=1
MSVPVVDNVAPPTCRNIPNDVAVNRSGNDCADCSSEKTVETSGSEVVVAARRIGRGCCCCLRCLLGEGGEDVSTSFSGTSLVCPSNELLVSQLLGVVVTGPLGRRRRLKSGSEWTETSSASSSLGMMID